MNLLEVVVEGESRFNVVKFDIEVFAHERELE